VDFVYTCHATVEHLVRAEANHLLGVFDDPMRCVQSHGILHRVKLIRRCFLTWEDRGRGELLARVVFLQFGHEPRGESSSCESTHRVNELETLKLVTLLDLVLDAILDSLSQCLAAHIVIPA